MQDGSNTPSPGPGRPGDPGDGRPVIVYDGLCAMCSASVQFVLRAGGPDGRHLFASAQSPLGEELYRRHGHRTENHTTLLLVQDGRCRTKADAVLAILASLGGPWGLAARAGRRLPVTWLDRCYDLVARNRYRILGRLDACRRPPAGAEGRFLS